MVLAGKENATFTSVCAKRRVRWVVPVLMVSILAVSAFYPLSDFFVMNVAAPAPADVYISSSKNHWEGFTPDVSALVDETVYDVKVEDTGTHRQVEYGLSGNVWDIVRNTGGGVDTQINVGVEVTANTRHTLGHNQGSFYHYDFYGTWWADRTSAMDVELALGGQHAVWFDIESYLTSWYKTAYVRHLASYFDYVFVSENGFVILHSSLLTVIPDYTQYADAPPVWFANAQKPNFVIAPYWCDMHLDAASHIRISYGEGFGGPWLKIAWIDVKDASNRPQTFGLGLSLAPPGDISWGTEYLHFQYGKINTDNAQAVGFEDQTGRYGIEYSTFVDSAYASTAQPATADPGMYFWVTPSDSNWWVIDKVTVYAYKYYWKNGAWQADNADSGISIKGLLQNTEPGGVNIPVVKDRVGDYVEYIDDLRETQRMSTYLNAGSALLTATGAILTATGVGAPAGVPLMMLGVAGFGLRGAGTVAGALAPAAPGHIVEPASKTDTYGYCQFDTLEGLSAQKTFASDVTVMPLFQWDLYSNARKHKMVIYSTVELSNQKGLGSYSFTSGSIEFVIDPTQTTLYDRTSSVDGSYPHAQYVRFGKVQRNPDGVTRTGYHLDTDTSVAKDKDYYMMVWRRFSSTPGEPLPGEANGDYWTGQDGCIKVSGWFKVSDTLDTNPNLAGIREGSRYIEVFVMYHDDDPAPGYGTDGSVFEPDATLLLGSPGTATGWNNWKYFEKALEIEPNKKVKIGVGRTDHASVLPGNYQLSLEMVDVTVKEDCRSPVAAIKNAPLTGKPNTDITFDASTSYDPDGTITTYAWYFQPAYVWEYGVTATERWTTEGTYTVYLLVTDNDGITDLYYYEIQIISNVAPVAGIRNAPLSGQVNFEITFDGSASYDPDGSITQYAWQFDPAHVWEYGITTTERWITPGSYTVYLLVTDNGGLTDLFWYVIQITGPVLWSKYDESSGTAGDSSGNGRIGTLYGVNFVTGGASGNCVNFNGGEYNDRVDYGNVATITGDITISLMVKTTSTRPLMFLVAKAPNTGYDRTYELDVGYNSATMQYSVSFSRGNSLANDWLLFVQYTGAWSVLQDGWHWIRARHNTVTGEYGISVDNGPWGGTLLAGARIGSATSTTAALQVGNLGSGISGSTRSFVGYIDSVRIWDRYLSDSEFNQAPIASFTSGSVGLTANVDGRASYDPDGAGAINMYVWTWGDGQYDYSPTLSTASHTYTAAGTYTVQLTVGDEYGAAGSASKSVPVGVPSTYTLAVSTSSSARGTTSPIPGTYTYSANTYSQTFTPVENPGFYCDYWLIDNVRTYTWEVRMYMDRNHVIKAHFASYSGCVAEGTEVLMADHSTKVIERIKVGDQVLGYDPVTGSFVAETVLETHKTLQTSLLSINGGALEVTLFDQRIWVRHDAFEDWVVNPVDLQVGWEIYAIMEGKWVTIESLEISDGRFWVYDITTDGPQTYVANSFLVKDKPI